MTGLVREYGYGVLGRITLLVLFAGHALFAVAEAQTPRMDDRGVFLYVVNNGSAAISAFRIDAKNGALALVKGSPYATGEGPYSAAADPNGTTLFVTNSTPGTISAYRIDATSGEM
ncbi:MAG: beta-propeller fold lactonase family protein, partial [Burkholderiales bacterium]